MISAISLNHTIGDKLANNAARIAVLSLILSLVAMYLSYSAFTGLGLGFGKSLPIGYTLGAASLLFIVDAIRYARMHLNKTNIPQNIPQKETISGILQTACGISRPLADLIDGYAKQTEYLVAIDSYANPPYFQRPPHGVGSVRCPNVQGTQYGILHRVVDSYLLEIKSISFIQGISHQTFTNESQIQGHLAETRYASNLLDTQNIGFYHLHIRLVKVGEDGVFREPNIGETINLNYLDEEYYLE